MTALAANPLYRQALGPSSSPASACSAPLEWHLDRAISAANFEASRRVALRHIRPGELEDFVQELLLKAISNWSKFDLRRGKASTYLAVVMRYAACSILRARRAAVRGGGRTSYSLNERTSAGLQAMNDQDQIELHNDVRTVLAVLPKELQPLAKGLMTKGITAAARNLRLSHRVALSQRNQIRECFVTAGLAPGKDE